MVDLLASFIPSIVDSFSKEKVNGVPTPQGYGGLEGGKEYSAFMDGAFPGTTAWERLGASTPVGPVEAAKKGSDTQERMQGKELFTRRSVADLQARAQVLSALGPTSPMAARSVLDMLYGRSGSDYDTHTKQGRDKTPSEIAKTEAEADRTNITNTATRPFSKLLDKGAEGIMAMTDWAGSKAGKAYADAEDLYNRARGHYQGHRRRHNGI